MKTLISVYCHQRLLFTRYIVIYLFIPRARLNFVQAVFIRFQGFMEKFIEINILVFQDIQASSLCILVHQGLVARNVAFVYAVNPQRLINKTHLGITLKHL